MFEALFGMPGSGKTSIGELLRDEFGFFFYDIDDDLTPGIKEFIRRGEVVPYSMREHFFDDVLVKVRALREQHENLVIAQAFVFYATRHKFMEVFPDLVWVLVSFDDAVRKKRLSKRRHIVDPKYAKLADGMFEKPDFDCVLIDNSGTLRDSATQIKEKGLIENRKRY